MFEKSGLPLTIIFTTNFWILIIQYISRYTAWKESKIYAIYHSRIYSQITQVMVQWWLMKTLHRYIFFQSKHTAFFRYFLQLKIFELYFKIPVITNQTVVLVWQVSFCRLWKKRNSIYFPAAQFIFFFFFLHRDVRLQILAFQDLLPQCSFPF